MRTSIRIPAGIGDSGLKTSASLEMQTVVPHPEKRTHKGRLRAVLATADDPVFAGGASISGP
jgi:hypothetical protein